MDLRQITVEQKTDWDTRLQRLPTPHLLQSWEWGELKRAFGWQARRLAWEDEAGQTVATAQLLNRSVRLPFVGRSVCLEYCPKGPTLDWADAELRSHVMPPLIEAAKYYGAFVLKIDPEVVFASDGTIEHGSSDPSNSNTAGQQTSYPDPSRRGDGASAPGGLPLGAPAGAAVEAELSRSGWRRSGDKVQFRNTLMLDLRKDEDTLLADMKQKWRYNVRLSGRKGVTVRRGGLDDLDLLYRMYAHTAARDGFVIRTRDYYRKAWGNFTEAGLAQPLIAEVEGEPVAGQVVYRFGKTGWYLYGMSTDLHREKMPNHALHWEAIRWAKQHGCEVYDFVGAPEELEESDPMWGVYRFKQGFGGEFVQTVGEWDFPLQPTVYWAYRLLWPRALSVMRLFGRRRVAAEAAS